MISWDMKMCNQVQTVLLQPGERGQSRKFRMPWVWLIQVTHPKMVLCLASCRPALPLWACKPLHTWTLTLAQYQGITGFLGGFDPDHCTTEIILFIILLACICYCIVIKRFFFSSLKLLVWYLLPYSKPIAGQGYVKPLLLLRIS